MALESPVADWFVLAGKDRFLCKGLLVGVGRVSLGNRRVPSHVLTRLGLGLTVAFIPARLSLSSFILELRSDALASAADARSCHTSLCLQGSSSRVIGSTRTLAPHAHFLPVLRAQVLLGKSPNNPAQRHRPSRVSFRFLGCGVHLSASANRRFKSWSFALYTLEQSWLVNMLALALSIDACDAAALFVSSSA